MVSPNNFLVVRINWSRFGEGLFVIYKLLFIDKHHDVIYNLHMIEIRQTEIFQKWFAGLKDRRANQIIAKRLVRIEAGLVGDVKSVGDRVSEIRIKHGKGYRLYFTKRGETIILLLCGGDKGSQARDIRSAKRMEKEIDHEDD